MRFKFVLKGDVEGADGVLVHKALLEAIDGVKCPDPNHVIDISGAILESIQVAEVKDRD